jgi:hypothetical protein
MFGKKGKLNIPKSMLSQIQDVSKNDAQKEYDVIKLTIDDIFYQRASTVDLKKLLE